MIRLSHYYNIHWPFYKFLRMTICFSAAVLTSRRQWISELEFFTMFPSTPKQKQGLGQALYYTLASCHVCSIDDLLFKGFLLSSHRARQSCRVESLPALEGSVTAAAAKRKAMKRTGGRSVRNGSTSLMVSPHFYSLAVCQHKIRVPFCSGVNNSSKY
jgi:hypothetical protein